MTATQQQRLGAYNQHQRTQESDRDMDKRALLTSASRLKTALDDGGKDMAAYRAALQLNQQLWTIFQVAVTDPASPLPRDLKITLLNLSRYVDRVSFRAVSEFMPDLLISLIEIDRTIANGLTSQPAAATPAAAYEPVPAAAPAGYGAPPPAGMPTSIMTSA